jgi:hypothetical protein
MRYKTLLGSSLTAALLVCSAFAAEDLKSGPQVGSTKIPAFNPLNVTGKQAGTKTCQV